MKLDDILNRNFTDISDEYRQFATQKDGCRKCSIFDCYKQVGQSEGNARNPTFMIIGEALGADEAEQVRPFVGRAGQRLREELRKHPHVFDKQTCLITNTVCCRPVNNKFPRDADGPWDIKNGRTKKVYKAHLVVNNCVENWLFKEIKMLKPKVIITLGGQSLEWVRKQRGITNSRGNWLFLNPFRAWSFATYHPSYVLRCVNDPNKKHIVKEFENDIKKISETWQQIVDTDERMSMTDDEWDRECSFQFAASKYLAKGQPIDPSDPVVNVWNNL